MVPDQSDGQLPVTQKLNSMKSINSQIVDDAQKQQQQCQQVEQMYEIQTKKNNSQFNRNSILDIFNSLPAEQPKRKQSKNKKPQQLVKRPSKPENKILFSHLSDKTRQNIDRMLKLFRSSYKPSSIEAQVQKVRYEHKQKMYHHLLYGVEELKLLHKIELSPKQIQIIGMNQNDISKYIRGIMFQVDKMFLDQLNKNNKTNATRQFRMQWSFLTTNISDDRNRELRRKILNKQFTAQQMVQAKQIQFYTSERREQIIRKQKIYLAQFEAQQKVNQPIETQEIIDQPKIQMVQLSEQLQAQSSTKKFNSSILLELKQLLSTNHLLKMKKRIQDDIPAKYQQRLLSHLTNVFPQLQ